MENKRYIVTLRAKSTPHQVDAKTVKTEGGRVIFLNSDDEETANFNAADVMGYSLKPVDDEDDMPPIGGMA